jgi:SpoVK/Ycf46/Vps4 family AAA+-type ATPase
MPEKTSEKQNDKITLSFLLNLFDGVLETPGRLVIMTTNFIDKLDKAFTRPGRIDICCKLGFANCEQIIEIIEHRYDAKLTDEQLNIIQNIANCITPAEIGRILFENFDNLDGAIKSIIEYSAICMDKIAAKKLEQETANNSDPLLSDNISNDYSQEITLLNENPINENPINENPINEILSYDCDGGLGFSTL